MKKFLLAMVAVLMLAGPAFAGKATLSWKDNSDNEAVFNIERKAAACTSTTVPWAEIATVPSNIVTYVDLALTEGATYCYRVAASNTAGKSAYTNEVPFLVPFSIPVAPSQLSVGN